MNKAQYHRLDRWLALLPGDVAAKDPFLAITKAIIALENGQVEEIFANMEQARRMVTAFFQGSSEYATLQAEIDT